MRRLLLMFALLISFTALTASTTTAQTIQNICANTAIPNGWILIDDAHIPFICGNPISPFDRNVWIIQRYDNMSRNAFMTVCNPIRSGAPPGFGQPPGWAFVDDFHDSFTCGAPFNLQVQNRAIIRCLNCPDPPPPPPQPPGPDFEGHFDQANCDVIQGWVWNRREPNMPLRVDVIVNGTVLMQVTADVFRQDLLNAGKGDGRHAFNIPVPPRLKNARNNSIGIRVVGTNFFIGASPRTINCPNPIEDARFFVKQQYNDFLAREPDGPGWDFWTNQILGCGADAACREHMRVQVSKAFFLSIEFQETGYFLHRFYRAAFGRMPTLTEFSTDKALLSQNVIVGFPGWEATLNANKAAYTSTFVTRSNFTTIYNPLLNHEFVNQLMANAQITDQTLRNNLINGLNTGQLSRANVMRQIVDDGGFFQREFNPAFVMMQYIGYLRRHPSDPPDGPNMPGFFFWLNKLNTQGDQNEMVRAFILSIEYRARFGSDDPFPGGSPPAFFEAVPPPPCADNDGDGFCDDLECNPYDPTIYPGAPIYCNYGEDRNCNWIDDHVECYGW